MNTKVKICGITRVEDAVYAESLGADAIGFIFHKASPRFILPKEAGEISSQLGPFIARVGVFVNESIENILETIKLAGLNTIQLHGNNLPNLVEDLDGIRIIKAFNVGPDFSYDKMEFIKNIYQINTFLLDAYMPGSYGGTGRTFDWSVLDECRNLGRIILAGGLNPSNIRDAITSVTPWGVDISTGVEISPGMKDHNKLLQLFETIHGI